jgi:hypothetical protein
MVKAMGWQDRDWAKLDEQELGSLYGGGGSKKPRRRSGVSRTILWSVIVLVAALAGAYILGRPSSPPVEGPTLIYGHAMTLGGQPAACVETAFNAELHDWICLTINGNPEHLPVVEPKAYVGPCADAVADQANGRWVCQGNTPLPPSDLPSTRVFATPPAVQPPAAATT